MRDYKNAAVVVWEYLNSPDTYFTNCYNTFTLGNEYMCVIAKLFSRQLSCNFKLKVSGRRKENSPFFVCKGPRPYPHNVPISSEKAGTSEDMTMSTGELQHG